MAFFNNNNPPPSNNRLKCFHRYNFDTPNDATIADMISGAGGGQVAATRCLHLGGNTDGIQYGSGQDYHGVGKQRYQNSTERMKRLKELQSAEEDLKQLKEKKNTEKQKEIIDKRKDLEMLRDYDPWGTGGGGAPRFTKSGTVLAQRQRFVETPPTDSDNTLNPFGKPGGGAPRRSESGSVIASVVADPNTRFQKQLKKEVESSLRYKHSSNKPVATPTQIRRTDSEIELKLKEREEKARYAKRLEKQMEERPKTASIKPTFQSYFPWGCDQPNRNISGKILVRRRRDKEETTINIGAWLKGLGEKDTLQPVVPKNIEDNEYNPWGKPGGGAPLTNSSRKTLFSVFGNFEENKTKKEDESNEVISTATWVGRGKVGQPSRDRWRGTIIGGQSKLTSDITSQRMDIRRPPPQEVVAYYSQPMCSPGGYKTPYHTPSKVITRRRPQDTINTL